MTRLVKKIMEHTTTGFPQLLGGGGSGIVIIYFKCSLYTYRTRSVTVNENTPNHV